MYSCCISTHLYCIPADLNCNIMHLNSMARLIQSSFQDQLKIYLYYFNFSIHCHRCLIETCSFQLNHKSVFRYLGRCLNLRVPQSLVSCGYRDLSNTESQLPVSSIPLTCNSEQALRVTPSSSLQRLLSALVIEELCRESSCLDCLYISISSKVKSSQDKHLPDTRCCTRLSLRTVLL